MNRDEFESLIWPEHFQTTDGRRVPKARVLAALVTHAMPRYRMVRTLMRLGVESIAARKFADAIVTDGAVRDTQPTFRELLLAISEAHSGDADEGNKIATRVMKLLQEKSK